MSPEQFASTWAKDVLRPALEQAAGRDGRMSRTEAAKASALDSVAADNVQDIFEATGAARPGISTLVSVGEAQALSAARAAAGTDGVLSPAEAEGMGAQWSVDFNALVETPRLRFSESVLAQVMSRYGVSDRGALLAKAAASHDADGNGYLKRSELEAAARALSPANELGVVSDLDSTIIPAHAHGAAMPAPYPGIRALLHAIEFGNGGQSGDVHYVTARTPDRVVDIPEYLDEHALPDGSIDTGTSTLPWVAQPEKVKDIVALFEANPDQKFILFGDTKHRDPEVYREIVQRYPDRVVAAFIHKVNVTVNPARVEGLHLIHNYAEAAATLFKQGAIDEATARGVIAAARAEGLSLTDAQVEALFAP